MIRQIKNLVFSFLITLLVINFGFAQSEAPLFSNDSILEVKLFMEIKKVITDLEERNEHPAILKYYNSEGGLETQKLKVQVRGNNRSNPTVCQFPPIKLNFKKKKVTETLFDGQNKLKLVTHCNKGKSEQDWLLQEYYVYKMYQVISPYSLDVRLLKITYIDTINNQTVGPSYGFVIEDIDDLAERNQMIEWKDSVMNQEVCDKMVLDNFTFFQYLIGNLDWSVPYRHNVKIIANEENPVLFPVPYDFDYSGIVDKPYANPPPSFDISSVRYRVFRGFCRVPGGYQKNIDFYNEKKDDLIMVVTDDTYMSQKKKKMTLKYIESFYKTINSKWKADALIYKACTYDHKHLYEF